VRCDFSVLVYLRKAALCHLPKIWIRVSSNPASAAEVAAPILKLWRAYWVDGEVEILQTGPDLLGEPGFYNCSTLVIYKEWAQAGTPNPEVLAYCLHWANICSSGAQDYVGALTLLVTL